LDPDQKTELRGRNADDVRCVQDEEHIDEDERPRRREPVEHIANGGERHEE
jgi:hypothetical protein